MFVCHFNAFMNLLFVVMNNKFRGCVSVNVQVCQQHGGFINPRLSMKETLLRRDQNCQVPHRSRFIRSYKYHHFCNTFKLLGLNMSASKSMSGL